MGTGEQIRELGRELVKEDERTAACRRWPKRLDRDVRSRTNWHLSGLFDGSCARVVWRDLV